MEIACTAANIGAVCIFHLPICHTEAIFTHTNARAWSETVARSLFRPYCTLWTSVCVHTYFETCRSSGMEQRIEGWWANRGNPVSYVPQGGGTSTRAMLRPALWAAMGYIYSPYSHGPTLGKYVGSRGFSNICVCNAARFALWWLITQAAKAGRNWGSARADRRAPATGCRNERANERADVCASGLAVVLFGHTNYIGNFSMECKSRRFPAKPCPNGKAI